MLFNRIWWMRYLAPDTGEQGGGAQEPAAKDTAEPADNAADDADAGDKGGKLDKDQIEKAGRERAERARRAAMIDMFEQSGLDKDQAREAFDDYIKKQEAKEAERLKDVSNLRADYDRMKSNRDDLYLKSCKMLVKASAMTQAHALGVNPEYVEYAIKLADLTGIKIDEDGNVDDEAVRGALEQVLEDLPIFKTVEAEDDRAHGIKLGSPKKTESGDKLSSKISAIFNDDLY